MVWNYLKEISKSWLSWIFFVSEVVGIYTRVNNQELLFYPWVYEVVGLVFFIVANVLLYAKQENRIKEYELIDPRLVLSIQQSSIDLRNPGVVLFSDDGLPNDALNEYGVPKSPWLKVNIEIENFGKEQGRFEWEVFSIDLGEIFTYAYSKNGKFKYPDGTDFSNIVGGRDRFIGYWELEMRSTQNNGKELEKLLKDAHKYRIVMNYWTRKIGGKSDIRTVEISGDYIDFANQMSIILANRS